MNHSGTTSRHESPSPILVEILDRLNTLTALLAATQRPSGSVPSVPATSSEPRRPHLVTLDQAAAMVHRKKAPLWKRRDLPPADHIPPNGSAHRWEWTRIRPWLEQHFFVALPDEFPGPC